MRDVRIDKALVDTFIATAQQDGPLPFGPVGHFCMVEACADRSEQHHRRFAACRVGTVLADGLQAA